MKAGLMLGVNPNVKRDGNDFYATDPYALKIALPLLEELEILNKKNQIIEPSCGNGHLSEVLRQNGYKVDSYDKIQRSYPCIVKDFLKFTRQDFKYDYENKTILTNPPFKFAYEFVEHCMYLLNEGEYGVFFLKVQFLETPKRKKLFEKYPPKYVIVNSERVCCAMNGEFSKYFNKDSKTGRYMGGTQMYCWYVFQKGYKGDTVIKWL